MILDNLFRLCEEESDHDKGLSMRKTYHEGYLPWFDSYRSGDKAYEKNLAGMTKNGLTETEAFFILAYTGGSSFWLNRDRRNGDPYSSKCKEEFANQLENALGKMPSFDNAIVYRMEIYTDGVETEALLKWFKRHQSKKFLTPYFFSTSKEDFHNSKLIWLIRTLPIFSKGRDIHNLTNNHTEMEVLFERNAKFAITGIDSKKGMVILDEVPPDSDVDFDLTGVYHKNIL
jgi:hypothetical protein